MKKIRLIICAVLFVFGYLSPANAQVMIMETVVGTGTAGFTGDGGAAATAEVNAPYAINIDVFGNMYIVDGSNNRIRKVSPSGIITSVAGQTGAAGYAGDNAAATAAKLNAPTGVVTDPSGNVYIADEANIRIRKINISTGIITTICGTGIAGSSPDGTAATACAIEGPRQLVFDATGNLYFTDVGNTTGDRIRMINTSGIVSTIAGAATAGNTGDFGAATAALLNAPRGLALDGSGNLYVADMTNNRVRRINLSSGIIYPFAGIYYTGPGVYAGDGGQATAAQLAAPIGVTVDPSGNVVVTDVTNNRIRSVSAATGIITTIAGLGGAGGFLDGVAATAAKINSPRVAQFLPNGNYYISDATNNRIRYVYPNHTPYFLAGSHSTLNVCADVSPYNINSTLAVVDSDKDQVETWWVVTPPLHGSLLIATTQASDGALVTAAGTQHYNPTLGYSGLDSFVVGVNDGLDSAYDTVIVVNTGPPVITSLSPSVGFPASTVTISGNWFNASAASDFVFFGATQATVTSASATSLTVTVPSGATYMPVSVENFTCQYTGYSQYQFIPDFSTTCFSSTPNFDPKIDFTAGSAPEGAAIGDIDGDGKPDIVVCNNSSNSITVFRNTSATGAISAGSFAAGVSFSTGAGTSPNGVAIGDLDGDGWPEIVVSNQVGATVFVFYNTAAVGTITSSSLSGPTAYAVSGPCSSVAIGDLDKDGKPDIVTANGSTGISVLRSTSVYGSVSFASYVNYTTPNLPAGIVIGDIDGDGKPDIATANGTSTNASVFRNTSSPGVINSGSFAAGVDFTTGTNPEGIALSDIDGDGKPELIVVNHGSNSVSVFQNTATSGSITSGSFAAKTDFTTGAAPWGLAIADINGDGKPDIAVSNTTDNTASVLVNTATSGTINSSSLAGKVDFTSGGAPYSLAVGDMDADGIPELVVANAGSGSVSVLKNSPLSNINPITGSATVCVGSTINLSTTTTGGSWSSGSLISATVDPSSGVVTGVSPGTDITITYTKGTCFITTTINVLAAPSPIIPSSATICVAATTTLTDPTSGGAWSSTNSHASVVGGTVTGASAGVDTILYTQGGCSANATVSVDAPPAAISPATGQVCVNGTISLTDASSGGTWGVKHAHASVVNGVVTGLLSGVDTITYSVGVCAAAAATAPITINALPSNITPPAPVTVCVGATTTLGDVSSGVWSSGASGTASVGSTGIVTGNSPGSVTISFTNSSGCAATKIVTVSITPGPLSPAAAPVCIGSTITLTDGVGLGTWSAKNGNATVVGGVVTGALSGKDTIVYTIGTCATTANVTVNANPSAITPAGPVDFCVGSGATLGDTSPGGAWSSSASGIASVGTGGSVTGASAGTANILYTNAAGCAAIKVVTVDVTPGPISPSSSIVCTGSTDPLTDGVFGGAWTADASGHAGVSGSGIVTGISVGNATITYAIGACSTTATVTVNLTATAGAIVGVPSICLGAPSTFTDGTATVGGSWSSSNTAIATVGSLSGIVSGVALGNATISFSVTNSCGTAITTQTVNVTTSTTAGVISGVPTICAGNFAMLTDPAPGGVWSVSNGSAAISGIGLLTGIAPGADTVSYTVTNGCGAVTATKIISVGPYLTAGAIAGPSGVCVGAPSTFTDIAPSGTWTMSNANASVSGGVVTGLITGLDTVLYSVISPSGCGSAQAAYPVSVNPVADAGTLSGPAMLCAGASGAYSDAIGGGVWSSSNSSAAITLTGGLLAVSPGIDTVKYSVTNSCGTTVSTAILTIGPAISAGTIFGAGSVCAGSTVALTDGIAGGTWSAANSNATVTGGTVTGVTAGTDAISYTVTSSCGTAVTATTVTINPVAVAGTISGPSLLCVGGFALCTDTAPDGVWSSSNATASVTSGGLVSAASPGVDTIYYSVTNSCGTVSAYQVVNITATISAGSITGPGSVCAGASITLADASPGGTWSSSNANATVSGGVVSGVSGGMDTISYNVSSSCGTAIATAVVVINSAPAPGTITGVADVCIGTTTTLSDAVTGGAWSAANPNATVSGGVVTGVTAGSDIISYAVTNGCGTAYATLPVTITSTPDPGVISGASNVCIGAAITLMDPIGGGAWLSSNTDASVSGGVVSGLAEGTDTILYVVTTACGTSVATSIIDVELLSSVTISGSTYVCVGGTMTLSGSVTGGVWSSTNNARATVAGGLVTAITGGLDTIRYAVTNSCGTIAAAKPISIIQAPAPGTISGPSSVCVGSSISLTDGVSGGSWTSSTPSIATVSGGVVSGVATGSATINYKVTNSCGSRTATHAVTVNSATDCNPTMVNTTQGATEDELKVYPNPNMGMFTVEVASGNDETVYVTVTNIIGKKVKEFTTTTNNATEVQLGQPAGIYLLSATTTNGKYVVKVIIQ